MQRIGKYQLVRKIASGGMAEVYLAKAAGPAGFQKTVVVKQVFPHLAEDAQFVGMFLSEARLAAQLNHPNVVQVFDFGEDEGRYFLVMEYIDGPNLRALNRASRDMGQPLSFGVCAYLVSMACEGLAYAHDLTDAETGEPLHLIHRDVSPDNILVSRTAAVKVVDFGVAKAAIARPRTRSGAIKGKLAYMPPEQLARRPIDHRVDVFALGMVLYELLCGSTPFDSDSEVSIIQALMGPDELEPVRARRPDVPLELERIVARALAKSVERRYRSCREMQSDLERFLSIAGAPVGQRQVAVTLEELYASGVLQPMAPVRSPAAGSIVPMPPVPVREIAVTDPMDMDRDALADTRLQRSPRPHAPAGPSTAPGGTEAAVRAMRAPSRRTGALVGAVVGGALALVVGWWTTQSPPEEVEGPAAVATVSAPSPAQPDAPAVPAAPAEKASPPASPVGPVPAATATTPADEHPEEHPEKRPEERPEEHLEAEQASLEVETDPPLVVRVNGVLFGRAPVLVTGLKTGAARVELSDDALGVRREELVQLRPGHNGKRMFGLRTATVEFRVRPYAQVYVDGQELGQTPFAPVPLHEGKHVVRLVNLDLEKDVQVEYVVLGEQRQIFRYDLKASPP